MAKARIRPDLAARLAAGPIARHIEHVAEAIARAARENAPAAKTWQTHQDERVRHSHATVHGDTIPANVPFRLPAMTYVRKGRDKHGKAINQAGGWKVIPGVWDLADRPLDPSLPLHQRVECRCKRRDIPGMVAAGIYATQAVPAATRVHAKVIARFPRVAESEFAEHGGDWLRSAARAVAARHRATHPPRR
ncbi:hypothetical protein ACQP25_45010 (plasmid) [Microtetraspora malaysiensis]|uniref:hypothetical protein n=1 Tax=Microtetraspora malaysiensis TaxID=161358 RepID=UPI003D8A9736